MTLNREGIVAVIKAVAEENPADAKAFRESLQRKFGGELLAGMTLAELLASITIGDLLDIFEWAETLKT